MADIQQPENSFMKVVYVLKSIIASPQATILEQALNAASLRHKVIANNIANVNTPGFKKSEVPFETHLQEALANKQLPLTVTHERHIELNPQAVTPPTARTLSDFSLRTDGNNVDIDIEMAELAKNNIYYDAVVQQLSRYFSNVKSVIKGQS
jgi:flagellar basal-body rod protein FlgB